ncbi:MAG: PilZ domain [Nitrospirae bacterium]|nr:PilZ domain [Nitrospirota bacterium]
MANKRLVSKRHTKRLPVIFSNGDSEFAGTTSNLSSTGLFIRTRKALNPGTLLKIVLEVDKDKKINLEGEVAWSLKTGLADFKNGMGVKLKDIPQAYEELIKEARSRSL